MPRPTKLPLQRQITVREVRDTLLLHTRSKTAAGAAIDLSAYALRGDVKAAKGAAGVAICAVRFANDLANGEIKAYLTEADAAAIIAAVGFDATAYADIVRQGPDGWDEQLAEIEITTAQVVTGEAQP